MVTTKRRITTGLIATGLGASMGLVPFAASAAPGPAPQPPVDHARPTGVELFAHMRSTHKYPHAHGFALYKLDFGKRDMGRPGGGGPADLTVPRPGPQFNHVKKEFFIEVSGIRALHGKTLVVKADDRFIGTMRVSKYGKAELKRHWRVPWLRSGDNVRVKTRSGKLVSYGTLYKKHMHRDGGGMYPRPDGVVR